MRSTREVIEDHLARAKVGDLEGDLAENYSDDVLIVSHQGIGRGHDEVRRFARMLMDDLPDQEFDYHQIEIVDDVGFLVWSGTSPISAVPYGTDTYLVRDGKIAVQTWFYTVEQRA